MNTRRLTRIIAEGGIMLALATGLSMLTVFRMPQGGSITPASMIPILFFALRWGFKPGIMVSFAYGLIQFMVGFQALGPWSILLDYVLAFGVLGVAGLFNKKGKITFIKSMMAIALALISRYIIHVISGAVLYASYAPEGQNAWIYSIIYNISYFGPEALITMVVAPILYKPVLERFTPEPENKKYN